MIQGDLKLVASSFLATRRLGVFSKIAIPSIVGSATTTITSAVSTALISFNLGTENYVAYSMVYVAFGFVDSLHGGIPGAKDILVSQAIGAGNILGGGTVRTSRFLDGTCLHNTIVRSCVVAVSRLYRSLGTGAGNRPYVPFSFESTEISFNKFVGSNSLSLSLSRIMLL